jgi:hypothetical protein
LKSDDDVDVVLPRFRGSIDKSTAVSTALSISNLASPTSTSLLPHDVEARRGNPKHRSRSEEEVEHKVRAEEGLVDRD